MGTSLVPEITCTQAYILFRFELSCVMFCLQYLYSKLFQRIIAIFGQV